MSEMVTTLQATLLVQGDDNVPVYCFTRAHAWLVVHDIKEVSDRVSDIGVLFWACVCDVSLCSGL